MQIQVIETVEIKKTVHVNFPHYFKVDVPLDDCECTIHGVFHSCEETAMITVTDDFNGKMSYEVEKEKAFNPSYLAKKYASTKGTFTRVAEDLQKCLMDLTGTGAQENRRAPGYNES